jgi:TolA-binding protein
VNYVMKRNFLTGLCALAAVSALVLTAEAQTRRGRGASATRAAAAAPPRAADPAALPLPASDAVVLVELRRLMTEAVPRALAGDTARLAEVNADIEQFKARTGLDARNFETLAVGARIRRLESGAVKLDHVVAVARGAFDQAAIVAAGRAAAGGRYAAQQHGGQTVHVFTVGDRIKLFGLLRLRVSELAVAALDANTLAVGEPEAVRAAVNARAGRGRADAALLNQARGAGDLIAFAGNVAPTTFAGIDIGLPEVNRSIAAIRGFRGTVGLTPAGYSLTTVLRSATAPDARQLGNTVEALRVVVPGLVPLAGERARMAKSAAENLKITTQGTEVQLRLDLKQDDFAMLLRSL